MEAKKLKTVDDLMASEDERIELINGEIRRRPMARQEHAAIQLGIGGEFIALGKRNKHEGGWWIRSEVSVRYSQHQCPTHDLAGWRKERIPERPSGIVEITPDWVCEITSPGHEKKDVFQPIVSPDSALLRR
ncbi:MAG: Uma2 family endonuclease [SAR324 cluster bacterium]|nr:Uma2 family endonuclease [SAR324 cluster bacterium]